jgi:hypothetical protein
MLKLGQEYNINMNKTKYILVLFLAVIFSGCTLQSPVVINNPPVIPTKTPIIITPIITAVPTIAAVVPTVDETSIIKSAIKQALVAKHGPTANSLTVTVSKIIGDYSSGGASASDGGGMWFGAKVNNLWKLVWDGNGTIECSDLINYPNYPNSLIPECYNSSTDKLVKR